MMLGFGTSRRSRLLLGLLSILVSGQASLMVLSNSAQAVYPNPVCMNQKALLPVNNAQVLQWKQTSLNQFHARAHVFGKVSKIYGIQGGDHYHFQIQIGSAPKDLIEVVYSRNFGTPEVALGAEAQVCGDYITSNAPAGGFPVSPDGALIHWVHENERGGGHENGFVILNDTLWGGKAPVPLNPKDEIPNPPFL